MNRKTVVFVTLSALVSFAVLASIGVGLGVGLSHVDSAHSHDTAQGPESSSSAWDHRSTVMYAVGSGTNRLDSVAISGDSVYGVGLFNGDITWGGLSVNASRPWGTYIMRTTLQGSVKWLQGLDTGIASSPFPRLSIENDDLYIAGGFTGNVSFGQFRIYRPVETTFVGRLNRDGEWIWVRTIGGNRITLPSDIHVDDDTIFVALNTRADTVSLGDMSITLSGSVLRPVVWALGTDGYPLWAIATGNGTSRDDRANALTYHDGIVYVTGAVRGDARFDDRVVNVTLLDATFVAATDGLSWLWVSYVESNRSNAGNDIAYSDHGLYVAGLYEGTAGFGQYTVSSAGGRDLFVARVGVEGEWDWVRSVGDTLNDYASTVVPTINSVHVAGSVRGNVSFGEYRYSTVNRTEQFYVANIDDDGHWRWVLGAKKISGSQTEALCVDTRGRRYAVGGFYDGSMQIGSTVLPYSPQTTSFLVISLDVETISECKS